MDFLRKNVKRRVERNEEKNHPVKKIDNVFDN
jgi:hypothetical protein